MSGYRFSAAQRFAVYTVHGGTCYLNGEPLYLKQMQIDHVIPRSLKNDPDRLSMVLKEYGLPDDFELEFVRKLVAHMRPLQFIEI